MFFFYVFFSLKDLEWRVDYTLGSSAIDTVQQPSIQLKMTVAGAGDAGTNVTRAALTASKFQLLLHELKEGAAVMADHA